MTRFLDWMTPCGARVVKCLELLEEEPTYLCTFDKAPVANDGTGELDYLDWVFLENGRHCVGFIDPLIPPRAVVDVTSSYTFNGEPVTVLTTGAAGIYSVIVQTRNGELKRFDRWGWGPEGIMEDVTT